MNYRLSKRLQLIGSEVSGAKLALDIGCDHGLLSEFLLDSDRAQRVIASDVSVGSLAKARVLLANYYPHRVQFAHGDGLLPAKELLTSPPDYIIIAGMGGLEIVKILEQGKSVIGEETILILSPHRDSRKLREYLLANNQQIKKDFCIEDTGHFYDCMRAIRGAMQLSDKELDFGLSNLDGANPAFKHKLEFEERVLRQKQELNNTQIIEEKINKILNIKREIYGDS